MSALAPLRARWDRLVGREKIMVAAAVAVVGLALVWWLLLGPPLATLRSAETQQRALDTQLQAMRAMQAQAQTLQSQPKQGHDEAVRLLELAARERLGATARLSIQGDRATLTLTGTAPDALAQWLTQARVNARALPGEARLVRNTNGLWEGSVAVTLPPR